MKFVDDIFSRIHHYPAHSSHHEDEISPRRAENYDISSSRVLLSSKRPSSSDYRSKITSDHHHEDFVPRSGLTFGESLLRHHDSDLEIRRGREDIHVSSGLEPGSQNFLESSNAWLKRSFSPSK